MNATEAKEVTLYVQSKKAITSFYRGTATQLETVSPGRDVPQGSASSGGTNISPEVGHAETAYILPDQQARVVAFLQEIAPPRGYSVKLIDVTRSNLVKKLLDTHLSGVEHYPVLVSPFGGKRLEGPDAFTEHALLDLMPADLPNVRAFTQLKVDPSKIDDIRTSLLGFPEVKEVHLITGDWDVYTVLEFPGSGSGKKHVFDFVLQKVAKVPGVQDFSTMIPEYSMTKFPF